MSLQFPEEEIKLLFANFQSIRRYADRIHFFDRHFNIMPFEFPEFETDVCKFFSAANMSRLTEILRVEQKDLSFLDRSFYFSDTTYTFSVRPSSSQGITLNNYIISKFQHRDSPLNSLFIQRNKAAGRAASSQIELFEECNKMIMYLHQRIESEYDRKPSVEIQFITVFMKGYSDSIREVRRLVFDRRRKFLELYLYVYGFLYGKYMGRLSYSRDHGQKPELEKKIELLQELGVMDAIKRKYFSLNREELNLKAVEIVGFITGEHSKKLTDKIDNIFAS